MIPPASEQVTVGAPPIVGSIDLISSLSGSATSTPVAVGCDHVVTLPAT